MKKTTLKWVVFFYSFTPQKYNNFQKPPNVLTFLTFVLNILKILAGLKIISYLCIIKLINQNVMEEIWKDIDWTTCYEVSNKGRVRNKFTKHILKSKPTPSHRHPQVRLSCGLWSEMQLTLSHLVYNAFNDNKVFYLYGHKGERIGHKDGNILNNNIENLYRY